MLQSDIDASIDPTIVSIRQSQSVVEVVLHELTLGIDHGVIFGKRRVGDAATYYNYARKLAFLLVLHEVNRIANAYQELDIAEEEWLNHEDIDSWEEVSFDHFCSGQTLTQCILDTRGGGRSHSTAPCAQEATGGWMDIPKSSGTAACCSHQAQSTKAGILRL